MMPSEESLKVLQMIESGQITAEQGIQLLNSAAAAPSAAPAPQPAPAPAPEHMVDLSPVHVESNSTLGWLRVRVTDTHTNRNKVTVNLPLSLMAAGMKIGAHFAPELEGINTAELVDELKKAGSMGKIVDVLDEEDGEHVEIFIE